MIAFAEDPWRQAWIAVDLDPEWPTDLVVNEEMFQLFVIPVENVRRDLAETIVCDGAQDSYEARCRQCHQVPLRTRHQTELEIQQGSSSPH